MTDLARTTLSTGTANEAVHLPGGMHYSCVRDGSCCRDFWEIRAEAEAAERIGGIDWRACSSLGPREKTPFTKPGKSGDHVCLKQIESACNFLDPQDNLCRLHKSHGFEIKPLVCRLFPHRFTQTPGGVYVGLSFACTSVLEDSGARVKESTEELRASLERDDLCVRVADPIRFDSAQTIEWDEYLAIEGALDAILAREGETVETCLTAGHVWLGILRQMLAVARTRGADGKEGPSARATLDYYVTHTRETDFSQAFEVARRPAAQRTVKRMLLGTFVSFRNSLRPRQWRLVAVARVLAQNCRHWLRVGSLRLDPLDWRVPYGQFRPDSADFAAPEMQRLLRRYFRHALFRKDAIRHTDLFWGYCYFVLTYGLAQWYAAAFRAGGKPAPAQALALVEKYFVLHSNFNQTFLYHPAVADFIQHFFRKPNFAHTVIYG